MHLALDFCPRLQHSYMSFQSSSFPFFHLSLFHFTRASQLLPTEFLLFLCFPPLCPVRCVSSLLKGRIKPLCHCLSCNIKLSLQSQIKDDLKDTDVIYHIKRECLHCFCGCRQLRFMWQPTCPTVCIHRTEQLYCVAFS